MKEYPSIERDIRYGEQVYLFDKLDGSNIRAEWSRKNGFWKFGRRNGLLDHSNPILLEAPELIQKKYSNELDRIFRDNRWMKAVAFFEFVGQNSFAGNHIAEAHDVVLFDVAYEKKGFMEPRDFVKVFKSVETAKLLYRGNFNKEIEAQINHGTLPGMTFEGVVAKGRLITPGRPLMFKVKNEAWIKKLKDFCRGDEALFAKMM